MARGKGKEKQPPPETQFDNTLATDENSWAAFGILDERGPPITGEYLIHWQGIDPETGKPYEHSWEAKKGVTQDLIDAWKAKKAKDPLLVGREGEKLKERQKARKRAEAATKRKGRNSKGGKPDSKGSSTAAAKTAETSKKRKRDTASVGASENGSKRARTPPRERRPTTPMTSEIASSPIAGPSKQPAKANDKHAHFAPEMSADVNDRTTASGSKSTPASRTTAVETPTPSKQPGTSAKQQPRPDSSTSGQKQQSKLATQSTTTKAGPSVVISGAQVTTKKDQASRPPAPKAPKASKPAAARRPDSVQTPVTFTLYVPKGARREAASAAKAAPSSSAGAGPSQNDPIIPFSSPASSDARGPSRKKHDDREEIDNVDSSVSQGQRSTAAKQSVTQPGPVPTSTSGRQVLENESGVRLQERIINGKTVMIAITESMSTADSPSVPETQVARPPFQPDYLVDDLLSVAHEMMAGRPDSVETGVSADAEASMPDLPLEQVSEEMQGMVDEESSVVDSSTDHTGSLNPEKAATGASDESGTPIAVENQTPVTSRFGSAVEATVRGLKKKVIESPPQMTVDPRTFQQGSSAAPTPPLSPQRQPAGVVPPELVETVKELRQANADLLEKCQSLNADNEFLRKQYKLASDRAMEEVQRTEALEATVAQLRHQLKYGLKQRELHVDAIKSQRSAENTRLRAQMHILLQQSRLTDDAVRRKAARFSEMALRNAQLEKAQAQHAEQLQALEERNEELLEQVEMLRANQLGVLDDSDDEGEDGEDDSEADSDIRGEVPLDRRKANGTPSKRDIDGDAVMRESSPIPRRAVEPAPAPTLAPVSTGNNASPQVPEAAAPSQPIASSLGDGQSVQLDKPVFGCRNHVAGEACKAVFATKAALEEHVYAVIDGKAIR